MGQNLSKLSSFKKSVLKNDNYVTNLIRKNLRDIRRFAEIVTLPSNEYFIRQGKKVDAFYVILDGLVDIYYSIGIKEPTYLCQYTSGSIIGQVKQESNPNYIVSAYTSTDCILLKIFYNKFNEFICKCNVEIYSNWITALNSSEDCLLEWGFTKFLPKEMRSIIACLSTPYVYDNNKCIIDADNIENRDVYIILRGRVKEVSHINSTDMLNQYTMGCIFNERPFFLDIPSNTYYISSSQSTVCLTIPYKLVEKLSTILQTLKNTFYYFMNLHKSDYIANCGIPFFSFIPPDRYLELNKSSTIERYNDNEIIINEGDKANEFFIIVYGNVNVFIKGRYISTLEAGKYFGEIGLVADVPRTATIRALNTTICIMFSRDSFTQFFKEQPETYAEFSIKLLREQTTIQPILIHSLGRQYFEQFCKKEHSIENIAFYITTEILRKIPRNHIKLKEKALEIWHRHISPNEAELQVNLSAENVQNIRNMIENEEFTPTMYDDAQLEIVTLMNDTLARFKKTPMFQDLLAQLGSYEDTQIADNKNSLRLNIGHHLSGSPIDNSIALIDNINFSSAEEENKA